MNIREKAICECYTGSVFCEGEERDAIYEYLSIKEGREIYTHEILDIVKKHKDSIKQDFIDVCEGKYKEADQSAQIEVDRDRYISIEKFKEYKERCITTNNCEGTNCLDCFYNNGGARGVIAVIRANWIERNGWFSCSHCHKAQEEKTRWCPNCGAVMNRKRDSMFCNPIEKLPKTAKSGGDSK